MNLKFQKMAVIALMMLIIIIFYFYNIYFLIYNIFFEICFLVGIKYILKIYIYL